MKGSEAELFEEQGDGRFKNNTTGCRHKPSARVAEGQGCSTAREYVDDALIKAIAPSRPRHVACSPGLRAGDPLVAVRAAWGAPGCPTRHPGRPRSRPRNTEDRAKPGQAATATTTNTRDSPTLVESNKYGQDSRIRRG
jgi:hypothetical protein